MSRATGRIHLSAITDDQGGYVDNQTSRLYRFLRENTGKAYTGVQLDVDFFHQHRARNTSTRKSEINAQVDPSVEWICHWSAKVNPADPKSACTTLQSFEVRAGVGRLER
jgi:hypothetical protein